MSLEEMQLAIWKKCDSLFKKFGLKTPKIFFVDSNSDHVGGMAGWCRNKYFLLFPNSLIKNNFQNYMDDVVPHEVAHIIQKIKYPQAKQKHGREWKALTLALGGSGKIYHNMV